MKDWEQVFDGEYLDLWKTPKRNDGKYDIVLAIGGTHQYFSVEVFSELIHGTGIVSHQLFRPKDGCYQ